MQNVYIKDKGFSKTSNGYFRQYNGLIATHILIIFVGLNKGNP